MDVAVYAMHRHRRQPPSDNADSPTGAVLVAADTPELAAAHAEALHVAASKITNAVEDRDDAIREAYRDGVGAKAIAEAVGLSRQRVWQIVNPPS